MEVFRGSVHKRRVRCIEEMFLLKLVHWSETESESEFEGGDVSTSYWCVEQPRTWLLHTRQARKKLVGKLCIVKGCRSIAGVSCQRRSWLSEPRSWPRSADILVAQL